MSYTWFSAGRHARRSASLARVAAVGALAALATPGNSNAQGFVDPTGDFRPGYVAANNPTTPDLDVTGGSVFFNGSAFIFQGTLAGPVDPNAPANQAYVYGINRGAGTARFAGLGLPNILFDAVVISRPNGPDVVNTCFPTACNVALPGSTVFNGNMFEVTVPVSFLPSTGFAFTDYTFNLWPRLIGQNGGVADLEISDFGPDNGNAPIAGVVPEPATALLLAPALLGLAVMRRRRAR